MRFGHVLLGLVALTFVQTSSGECSNGLPGVQTGDVCCSSDCGTCGGAGCSALPGGPDNCCSGRIKSSGMTCSETGAAPCIIDSETVCDNGLPGIQIDDICCGADCGACGGAGCSARPGGAASCCSGRIRASGMMCDLTNVAPCIVNGPTDPPVSPPTPPPPSPPTPTPPPPSPPTAYPPTYPTAYPPTYPTAYAPAYPTAYPPAYPTEYPKAYPTEYQPQYPTEHPTEYPKAYPTAYPPKYPTEYPTKYPKEYPTANPPPYPTAYPPAYQTEYPKEYPTAYPKYPTPDPPVLPGPSCPNNLPGVPNGEVCCEAQCGSCGGAGCGLRPGGPDGCCTGVIVSTGTLCSITMAAPCIIDN